MMQSIDDQEEAKNLAQNNESSGYERLNEIDNNDIVVSVSPKDIPKLIDDTSPTHSSSSADSIMNILSTNWEPHDKANSIKKQSKSNPQTPKITLKSASVSSPVTPHESVIRSRSQPTSRRASDTSLGNFNKFTKHYIIPAAKWAYSPLSNSKIRPKKNKVEEQYKIEYSVFKPLKNLFPIQNEQDFNAHWQHSLEEEPQHFNYPEYYISSTDFAKLIDEVTDLIELGDLKPERIAQGSSGSYFIYGKKPAESCIQKIYKAGVFKPKDEEPYGPLSPKWTKWLHRTFFPCFFGRSCLIPNLGYISEAAASVLDKQLLSYIVPHTEIVYLRSSAFYYSYWDRHTHTSRLPRKIGSFQIFLGGYMEAQIWFKLFPVPNDISNLPDKLEITVDLNETNLDLNFKWSKNSLQQFREELEKLVILDYIMRNTDRGLDNWMIKIEWKELARNKKVKKLMPIIKIGAIDSGLAFPWKRPDEWRSFPFGWLFLPLSIIGQPFSMKTRNHYLPLLTSSYWWETTVVKLKDVFQKDNDFKERMWLRQLAVLKGQAFNVVEVLKLTHAGPLELTRRENFLVWDDIMYVPVSVNNDIMINALESSIYDLNLKPAIFNKDNNFNTIDENNEMSSINDRTPLLQNSISRKNNETTSITSTNSEPQLNMSGFEYNLNYNNDEPPYHYENEEQGTRKVVIERLEKAKNRPPVFTWC